MTSNFTLRVRHGRELFELSFPDRGENTTLSALQAQIAARTSISASLQRLIGPKGALLMRGKVVMQQQPQQRADASSPSSSSSTTAEPETTLKDLGLSSGAQILLVGARGLGGGAASGAAVSFSAVNADSGNGAAQERQHADTGSLLVVPQADPFEPETTLLQCSYSRGYVNQIVYVCMTCIEAGVADPSHAICSSCAVVCHQNHDMQCWGVRRAARCDCCTESCVPTPAKKKRALLTTMPPSSSSAPSQQHNDHRGDNNDNEDGDDEPMVRAVRSARRCMFLADDKTHAAPLLPLPKNADNMYPPFAGLWCPCEWKQQQPPPPRLSSSNSQNMSAKSSLAPLSSLGHHHPPQQQQVQGQEQSQSPPDHVVNDDDDDDELWGSSDSATCTICGSVYWSRHITNVALRCDALACNPCMGVQSTLAAAFFCRTCSGFCCVSCRLHCHSGPAHDVEPTPYWFSSQTGGFVDPLRVRKKQRGGNNNNNNSNKDEEEDDDDDNDDNDGSNKTLVFACCCGGRCSIVTQTTTQQFIDAVPVVRRLAATAATRLDSDFDSREKLLHPKSARAVTVPRTRPPPTVGALLLDGFALFVCEPCVQHNNLPLSSINNDQTNSVLSLDKAARTFFRFFDDPQVNIGNAPCLSAPASNDALVCKNSSSNHSTTTINPASAVTAALLSRTTCIPTRQEHLQTAACRLSDSSSSRPHGALLPTVFFMWARRRYFCGCSECDAKWETMLLPGSRLLDDNHGGASCELSVQIAGACGNCKEILQPGSAWLCLTCEQEAADAENNTNKNSNTNGAALAAGSSSSSSFELCEKCYARKDAVHYPAHCFEQATLGNTLRQVFALIDAEGDAATRLWLREQLSGSADPAAVLDTIHEAMVGRVRLEVSERSLSMSVSMSVTHDDDDDDEEENDEEKNDEEEATYDDNDGSSGDGNKRAGARRQRK